MGSTGEAKCHKEEAASPPSLFQDGNIVFQAHHVGWIVSGAFTIIATIASFWLVNKHLQWYTNKREQRYIVRLLFLVPIYATISFASYLFWNHSTPLLLLRDAYEAIVLTAFFYLLLMYLSPDPEEQKKVFLKHGLSRENDISTKRTGEKLQKWVFPLGFVKWKPADGLFFLQLMKWGVLQYCVVRPVTTLAAVILDYMGLYCEESWGLGWGHVYITIIISLSVTIAMYCLIQLYVPVATQLAPHKPLLKLFSVKAVVFLTFWQATFLSVLSMFGVVKDTKYMTAEDINIGIGALLETFEMMIFAFLHIRAFTYKPYRPQHTPNSKNPPPIRTSRLRSLGNVIDFRETFHEIWIGCVYLFDKIRGKEPVGDLGARRAAHYESAFGRPRSSRPHRELDVYGCSKKTEKGMLPTVEVEVRQDVQVDIGGKQQWLGIGDNYGYGIGYLRRERSEGLQEQIERELQTRGYLVRTHEQDHIVAAAEIKKQRSGGKQRSWWRSVYSRLSQADPDPDDDLNVGASFATRRDTRRSHSRRQSRPSDTAQLLLHEVNRGFGDLPASCIVTPHEGVNRVPPGDNHLEYEYIRHSDGKQHFLALLAEDERTTSYQQRCVSAKGRAGYPVSPVEPYSSRTIPSMLPAVEETSVPSSYNGSGSFSGPIFPPNSENETTLELGHNSASVLSLSNDRNICTKSGSHARLVASASQDRNPGYSLKITGGTHPVVQEVKHDSHHSSIGLDMNLDDPPATGWSRLRLDDRNSPSSVRRLIPIQGQKLISNSPAVESSSSKLRTSTVKTPKILPSRHIRDTHIVQLDAYDSDRLPPVLPRDDSHSTRTGSLRALQQSYAPPLPRGLDSSPMTPQFTYQRQSRHASLSIDGISQGFMSVDTSSASKGLDKAPFPSVDYILHDDSSTHHRFPSFLPDQAFAERSAVVPGSFPTTKHQCMY